MSSSEIGSTQFVSGSPDVTSLVEMRSIAIHEISPSRDTMKCNRCSKPAVLHITELRNGEVQALHLCESCAKEHLNNGQSSKAPASSQVEPEIDEGTLSDLELQVCPNCGISFKEFRAQGRLGCAHDYVVFEDELLQLLENIHGETTHVGKIPKRSPQSSQIQFKLIKLRNELRTAIEEERYEDAARIRDSIRQIEEEQLKAESVGKPSEPAP